MKKKLTGYLLAGLMMASLTACGNGQTQDTAENHTTLEDQTKESPATGIWIRQIRYRERLQIQQRILQKGQRVLLTQTLHFCR